MKVITENQERNVISVDELTDNHTLVLIAKNEVRISKREWRNGGENEPFSLISLSGKTLSDGSVNMNANSYHTLRNLVKGIHNGYGSLTTIELHAFNSLKEALEFAITKL